MEKIIIRNVKFEDLKSVADIATRGWQTAYRGIVDDDYLNPTIKAVIISY